MDNNAMDIHTMQSMGGCSAVNGELLAEDLEFLSDREQEMITGGCLVVNGFVDGFRKTKGNDKCRGNATSAGAGNLAKNGKMPCFDVHGGHGGAICKVSIEDIYVYDRCDV